MTRRCFTAAVIFIATSVIVFWLASWACWETANFFGADKLLGIDDNGTFTFYWGSTLILAVVALVVACWGRQRELAKISSKAWPGDLTTRVVSDAPARTRHVASNERSWLERDSESPLSAVTDSPSLRVTGPMLPVIIRRTRHSDKSGKRGTLRPTAAMMAGVVNQLWDFDRLYDEVLMYG